MSRPTAGAGGAHPGGVRPAETPRIAGGRVPVLLHLLAPNYRPQQVTDDLASFWANTYPQVRKELRARYPKHAWPEDPTTAPARAGRGANGRLVGRCRRGNERPPTRRTACAAVAIRRGPPAARPGRPAKPDKQSGSSAAPPRRGRCSRPRCSRCSAHLAAAAHHRNLDFAGRAVVRVQARVCDRIRLLHLLLHALADQRQLRYVLAGKVLAARLVRQLLQRRLVDAVVVQVDRQLLEDLVQLLLVLGVKIFAARLLRPSPASPAR